MVRAVVTKRKYGVGCSSPPIATRKTASARCTVPALAQHPPPTTLRGCALCRCERSGGCAPLWEMKIACWCGWCVAAFAVVGVDAWRVFRDPRPALLLGSTSVERGAGVRPFVVVRGMWIVAREHASETYASFQVSRNSFRHNGIRAGKEMNPHGSDPSAHPEPTDDHGDAGRVPAGGGLGTRRGEGTAKRWC